jgi:hypothetical protein
MMLRRVLVLVVGLLALPLAAAAPSRVPTASAAVAALELGTKVVTTVPGQITAIRVWTLATDPGPHVGHVWTAAGQLLATVPFTGARVTGWMEQAVVPPLRIEPGPLVVVSVNVPAGAHFPLVTNGYATAPVQGPLMLPANAGAYGPPGSFPVSTSPHDYFRDVVFTPDPDLPPLATVTTGLGVTAPTGTLSVPAVVRGLVAPGAYTIAVLLTDPYGRITTARSMVLIEAYPIAAGDAPRAWAYTVTTPTGESFMSPSALAPSLAGGPFYAQVDVPALATGATAWTLYRTTAGGTTLRRVASVPAATRTYMDHTADLALGLAVVRPSAAIPRPRIAPAVRAAEPPK